MTNPHEDPPRPPDWALPNPNATPPTGQDAGAPGAGTGGPPVPGGTQAPGWGPAPGYGGPGYGAPGYGAPGYGQPGPPPGYGVPAWRPPALQPGIIPLRPLGLGAVVVAIQAVLTWYVGGLIAGALDDLARSADPTGELGLADQFGPSLATLLTTPFVALATTLLTGLLIVSVSR